jgi:hypothetical protein
MAWLDQAVRPMVGGKQRQVNDTEPVGLIQESQMTLNPRYTHNFGGRPSGSWNVSFRS